MRHFIVRTLGVVAGAAGLAATAHAADLPSRSAPPVFAAAPIINISDWSGVYVGSTYGWGFNSFKNSQGPASHTVNANGQTGGALIGYNFQTGHWVYGAEGSIDLNVIRKANAGGGIVPANDDDLYDMRFRGRVGYEFGRFLPFVAGGAVLSETYMSGTSGVAGVPGTVPNWFGRNRQSLGWTVGAGVEYKFNPQEFLPQLPSWIAGPMILRAEYIYDSKPTQTFAYGPAGNRQAYRTSSDGSTIRAAIIYRFGDNPVRVDVTPQGDVNWAGSYGGIMGGYGSASVKTSLVGTGLTTNSIGGDGGLGGIYAGTNFMFGHIMVGFDGSTSYSDFTGRGTLPGGDPVNYRSYIQADLRARAGYAFGRFLPFVAGGVGFSRSEQTDLATGSQKGRVPPDALTLGGGLDYRLSDRISLRLEYLHEFDSWKNGTQLSTAVPVGTPSNFNEERSVDIGRAGIAYHFE